MKTLAIVGAGFSGTVAAIEFIRTCQQPAEVILFDERGTFGPGVAYGSQNAGHVLNVPAGNMSALAKDPDSFVAHCAERGLAVHPGTFVSRVEYGRYLSSLLARTIAAAEGHVAVRRVKGQVVRVCPGSVGALLTLADGSVFNADHVLLACGNLPPSTPKPFATTASDRRYLDAPWSDADANPASSTGSVLLIGSGLTALDMIGRLARCGHSGPITALSRRGLSPQVHRGHSTYTPHHAQSTRELMLNAKPSARSYLRTVRQLVAHTPDADWRDIVAALRPCTPQLWRQLSLAEKRRFLRHVRPYWDNHRHRAAPESNEVLQATSDSGQLRVIKGRIRSAEAEADGIKCRITLTASGDTEEHRFDQVINCTGPSSRVTDNPSPLIRQLLDDGMLVVDPLELGIMIDDDYSIVGQSGEVLEWLSYIGPMLKSVYWEATAVPELRQHASTHGIALARKLSETVES